jgi:hypothetical protein
VTSNNQTAIAQTEILGYQIERTGNEPAPYLLHGPRGAVYGLLRFRSMPHLMYVMKMRGARVIVGIKGNYTFTDAGKTPRAWYGGH